MNSSPHLGGTEGVMSSSVSNEILQRLDKTGALLSGHFRLSSGLHSDRYIQCARLLSFPEHAAFVGTALAASVRASDLVPIDVVIGPALGGIIVAHEVARALQVPAMFAEREAGSLALRRGFSLAQGSRVLIVEDVVTTGGSALETAALVRSFGSTVVGFASIVLRGLSPQLAPLCSLYQVHPSLYPPEDCALCKRGLPIEKPGSRSVIHSP